MTYVPFADDFVGHKGEDEVDRESLLTALSHFLKANDLKADWDGIENAPNEALVNALAMMSPYGAAEKQALLEAPDLKTRAEILVAVTEIELAKGATRGRDPAAVNLRPALAARTPDVTCQTATPENPLPNRSLCMTTAPSDRPAGSIDPKLLEILVCPLTKGPLEYDAEQAGADLALRQARLSDPRRHPDHAARGSARARLSGARVRSLYRHRHGADPC